MHDCKIAKSDIIALTETHLRPLQNVDSILETFNDFQIVHQDLNNSYLSLAICVSKHEGVAVLNKQYFPEVNGILIKVTKGLIELKVLLLYRPKSMHPLQFCISLENIVTSSVIKFNFT